MDWHSKSEITLEILTERNFHWSLSDPVGAKGGTGQFSASEIQKNNLRVTFKKEIHQKVQGSKKKGQKNRIKIKKVNPQKTNICKENI